MKQSIQRASFIHKDQSLEFRLRPEKQKRALKNSKNGTKNGENARKRIERERKGTRNTEKRKETFSVEGKDSSELLGWCVTFMETWEEKWGWV